MKKEVCHTNGNVRLRGIMGQVYELLKENPTTSYLVKKLNLDRRIVSTYINRLVTKGYIKRLDRGVFCHTNFYQPLPQKSDLSYKWDSKNPYVLHNLEIKLLIPNSTHRVIKSYVSRIEHYVNIRNKSLYVNLGLKWQITGENVYVYFPSQWEIKASNPSEMSQIMYDVIEAAILKAERRFKITLFKQDRLNFEITNLHIAYRHNGLAHTLMDRGLKYILVRDSKDNKGRFLIDMSKGKPEPEFIHPEKALDDSNDWEFLARSLRDYKQLMTLDLPAIKKALVQIYGVGQQAPNPESSSEVQLSLKDNYFG